MTVAVVIDILTVLLIVIGIAALFYLIFFLKSATQNLNLITSDVHEMKEKIEPIITNLEEATGRANSIVERTEEYVDSMDQLIEELKSRYNSFSWGVKHDNPVADFIKNVSALSKGINAFWSKYKNHS